MKEKLILLHGALGSKNQFRPLMERLKEYFDMYTMNFEGHGGIGSLDTMVSYDKSEYVSNYCQIQS